MSLPPPDSELWLVFAKGLRQVTIMFLGLLEDLLGMKRTIPPRKERKQLKNPRQGEP